MKVISLLIITILLFSVATGVLAQEEELPAASSVELPDPGLTPNSPFYFLEIITEKIVSFFTFGDVAKAARYVNLAAERMAETQALAAKGKVKLVAKSLQRYENHLIKASQRLEKAKTAGKDTEAATKTIDEVRSKYYSLLEKGLDEVPEDLKPAIRHAMMVSTPEGLQLMEISEQGFASLKADCLAKGGPAEMCEKIPVQGFESFAALAAFCAEVGGPAEICSSLEAKCGEFGVTTANECFFFLSSSSATIKTAAPPTTKIAPEPVPVSEQIKTPAPTDYHYEDLQAQCLAAGGSAETCSKIPSGGFESFAAIEVYCLETGGSPEGCALLEGKCRSAGITSPDQCYLFLAISALGTFRSTELKAVPVGEVITRPEPPYQPRATEIEQPIIETQQKELKQRYLPGLSKVIIYSTPTCLHCTQAKDWFSEHGIAYEEIDISQDETIQKELIAQVGQLVVPIIKAEDDLIIGFNEERLSEFFGIE